MSNEKQSSVQTSSETLWDNLNRNLTAISISIKRWMGDIWCMWFSFGDFSYEFPASPGLIYLHLVIIWKDKQILLGEILVSLSLYTVIEPGWGKCAIIGEGRADTGGHTGNIFVTLLTPRLPYLCGTGDKLGDASFNKFYKITNRQKLIPPKPRWKLL